MNENFRSKLRRYVYSSSAITTAAMAAAVAGAAAVAAITPVPAHF